MKDLGARGAKREGEDKDDDRGDDEEESAEGEMVGEKEEEESEEEESEEEERPRRRTTKRRGERGREVKARARLAESAARNSMDIGMNSTAVRRGRMQERAALAVWLFEKGSCGVRQWKLRGETSVSLGRCVRNSGASQERKCGRDSRLVSGINPNHKVAVGQPFQRDGG